MDIETIKKRIQALLNKTAKRGATEAEAAAAMAKASELMKKHNIAEADLNGNLDQGIIVESVSTRLSNPLLHLFSGNLAELLDVRCFTSDEKEVKVIGLRDDVQIFSFLFETLERVCEENLKQYRKSDEYVIKIKMWGNGEGRRLSNSFRIGFFQRIGHRILIMYNERKKQRQNEAQFALVVANKEKRIQDYISQTGKLNPGGIYKPSSSRRVDHDAFLEGRIKGNEARIIQGIKSDLS